MSELTIGQVEKLAECFPTALLVHDATLAARSCDAPYGDNYDNKRCKTVDDLWQNGMNFVWSYRLNWN